VTILTFTFAAFKNSCLPVVDAVFQVFTQQISKQAQQVSQEKMTLR